MEVGDEIGRSAGTFTRPSNTTPYAAGQIVAASGAGAAVELTGAGRVVGRGGHVTHGLLLCSNTAATYAMRVHLWTVAPVATTHVTSLADAAAFALLTDTAYVGWLDFPAFASIGGQAGAQIAGLSQTFGGAASTSLWAVFVTPGAFTPVSAAVYRLVLKTSRS